VEVCLVADNNSLKRISTVTITWPLGKAKEE